MALLPASASPLPLLLERRDDDLGLAHAGALRDLAALSWQAFEEVIADAFRRHGYRVREVGGRGYADAGVDVVLEHDGETTIVQAKRWRRDRVGVALVRELYGRQRAMGCSGLGVFGLPRVPRDGIDPRRRVDRAPTLRGIMPNEWDRFVRAHRVHWD